MIKHKIKKMKNDIYVLIEIEKFKENETLENHFHICSCVMQTYIDCKIACHTIYSIAVAMQKIIRKQKKLKKMHEQIRFQIKSTYQKNNQNIYNLNIMATFSKGVNRLTKDQCFGRTIRTKVIQ